jgi:hypothetical protein
MISLVGRFNIVVDAEVTTNDVLLGRGAFADRFQGNIKFRTLIRQHKDAYRAAPHHHSKAAIAQQIVNAVHAYHGRFLRKLELVSNVAEQRGAEASGTKQSPVWEIVDNNVALEKVKQALRDIDQVDSKANRTPTVQHTASRCKSDGVTAKTNPKLLGSSSQAIQTPRRMLDPTTPSRRQGQRHQDETSPLAKKRAPGQGSSVGILDIIHATETLERNPEPNLENADQKPAAAIPAHYHPASLIEQNQRFPPAASAPSALSRYMPDGMGRHDGPFQPISRVGEQRQRSEHSAAATAAMVPLPMMQTGVAAPAVPMPQSPALSEIFWNEVAFSWREIPGAYLELLPLVREGRVRPFSSEDLQVFLLTLGWVESARDWQRLAQTRTVTAAILELPPQQRRLNSEEIECLISVMRRL